MAPVPCDRTAWISLHARALARKKREVFGAWREEMERERQASSDDDFVAPEVRQLEDIEDIEDPVPENEDKQLAPAKPAPAKPAPAPKTETKTKTKTKEQEEKAEKRRENKNVIQDPSFLPGRATEATPCPDESMDLWGGRCCCRAWTPANRMEVGNKNRKQTFGGRCKAEGKISLRDICERVGENMKSMEDYWEEEMAENNFSPKENDKCQAKADLYERSAEFWEQYPDKFNEEVRKQDPEGTKDMEDPADEVMLCKNHYNAFTQTGRTMGLRKKSTSSEKLFHPILTAEHPSRGNLGAEGEVITLNEQGFIWEDPEKFVFYGSSTSKDTKHDPPASVDTTQRSEWKEIITGKPWTINNASDSPLWQETGVVYW